MLTSLPLCSVISFERDAENQSWACQKHEALLLRIITLLLNSQVYLVIEV